MISSFNNFKPDTRFFFAQDNSCHWYMIPEDRRDEWNRLSNIEDSWELDEWQEFENYSLGGGIESITFTNPIEK